uniref:Uncharacterized protein n=1 Tax=Arundo donax TaxID=35708 RepID=A0A0A9AD50_ARUDO
MRAPGPCLSVSISIQNTAQRHIRSTEQSVRAHGQTLTYTEREKIKKETKAASFSSLFTSPHRFRRPPLHTWVEIILNSSSLSLRSCTSDSSQLDLSVVRSVF